MSVAGRPAAESRRQHPPSRSVPDLPLDEHMRDPGHRRRATGMVARPATVEVWWGPSTGKWTLLAGGRPMRMLFFAHSGLRYLVLLAGVLALVYFAYALATRKGSERTARILGSSFVGLLDLQIVIGLIMVVLGLYYAALMGHIAMMLMAAVVMHGVLVFARRSPDTARAYTLRFFGVLLSLVLVVAGIWAIGRSLLGSGAPTMIY
jgi:hypothetical protein